MKTFTITLLAVVGAAAMFVAALAIAMAAEIEPIVFEDGDDD